ncbi:MAG: hypothetical protein P1V20_28490 [Verrucomicrobiales bacterium]|nr:hypothetical protein [Verrucomicrobiales bacterium]
MEQLEIPPLERANRTPASEECKQWGGPEWQAPELDLDDGTTPVLYASEPLAAEELPVFIVV